MKDINPLNFSSTTDTPKRNWGILQCNESESETIKLLADEVRHKFLLNEAYRMNEREEVTYNLDQRRTILHEFTEKNVTWIKEDRKD
jgi:hypothetical protein